MRNPVAILMILAGLSMFSGCPYDMGSSKTIDRLSYISPDYTDIVIPPNIAPLNFQINEQGTEYLGEIFCLIG